MSRLKSVGKLMWLPVSELSVIWRQAQRPTNMKRVKKMHAKLDDRAIGTLSVGKLSDGSYHIVDGAHRRELIMLAWGPNEQAPCYVVDTATPEEAAKLFSTFNGGRTQQTPIEKFNVNLTAKEPLETAIYETVTALGFRIAANVADRNIRATTTLISVTKKHGIDVLRATLLTVRETWDYDAHSLDRHVLEGMALLLAEFQDEIDQNYLVGKLQKDRYTSRPRSLVGVAKNNSDSNGISIGEAMRNLLLKAYNSGLHGNHKLESLVGGRRDSPIVSAPNKTRQRQQ